MDFGADTVTCVDPRRGPVGSVTVGTAPYGPALGPDGLAWVALVPYTTRTGPAGTGGYRGGGMGIALSPDAGTA